MDVIARIAELSKDLPIEVLEDINKRITDWMSYEDSTIDDPYIQQQLRFAENFVNARKQKQNQ